MPKNYHNRFLKNKMLMKEIENNVYLIFHLTVSTGK